MTLRIPVVSSSPDWNRKAADGINGLIRTKLNKTDADATYLKITDAAATYLTQADAAATYLTIANAAATYALRGVNAWDAATGADDRTTFATYAGQTVSNPPTQAEVQAIDDHVKVISEHLKALIDDLKASGALA